MGYSIKDVLHNKAKELLHLETTPGLGCTEPAAIGLAAAAAAALLPDGTVESVRVLTDPGLYKNAMGVVIPHAEGANGVDLAAAMGAVAGDAGKGLEVFANVTPQGLQQARKLLRAGAVEAGFDKDADGLMVHAVVTGKGHSAEAVIRGEHDAIVSRSLDGQSIQSETPARHALSEEGLEKLQHWLLELTLADLVDIVGTMDSEDLDYIRRGLDMNMELAEYGLTHGPGIAAGRTQLSLMRQGLLCSDAPAQAAMLTAAGIDARMGGVPLPAMTLAGSGNQGIAAGIPVAAAAKFARLEEPILLLKAVTLSYLVTCSIKAGVGRLAPLCGSGVAGGAGVAAAMAYLFGGTVEKIGGAVKNHLGNCTPAICDGAKTGCAPKVAAMVGAAVTSALMALNGCVIRPTDGIVDVTPEATMKHVGRIARQGMAPMNDVVLDIMCNKEL